MIDHIIITPSALALIAAQVVAARVRPGRRRPRREWRQLHVNFKHGQEAQAIEQLAAGVARRGWRKFLPLETPSGGARAVAMTHRGVTVRLCSQWDMYRDETLHRFDVMGRA